MVESAASHFKTTGMILKINKADYERLMEALEAARKYETNARKSELYNLTKKKLKRQNK